MVKGRQTTRLLFYLIFSGFWCRVLLVFRSWPSVMPGCGKKAELRGSFSSCKFRPFSPPGSSMVYWGEVLKVNYLRNLSFLSHCIITLKLQSRLFCFLVCRGAGVGGELCLPSAGKSKEFVYLFPSSLCPFSQGVCPQNLQIPFSFSSLSQGVLKLSYISKTKVEQWCVKGFLIRPAEKYLPRSLCESGNFSYFKQENFVPQHWKNSV